jgi:hypothetical protein
MAASRRSPGRSRAVIKGPARRSARHARRAVPLRTAAAVGRGAGKPTLRPEDVLRCDKPNVAQWGAFDSEWYLQQHPEVRRELIDRSPRGVLRFYLKHGQRLGHSPNIFFDEAWYLKAHKRASDLVRSGAFRSGFDHYCGAGRDKYSPHWLFDDAVYKALHADVAAANLPRAGFLNRYDHFLRIGSSENRRPHILFDPPFYRAGMHDAELDRTGPFVHFLRLIHAGGEAQASIYFDPE